MESGKLERMYHVMNTPDIPRREGPLYLFGRTLPRRGLEEVIICQSDFVSRRHCHVSYKNGAYWIQDMKSLNGTYLNDERLMPNVDRELRFGDRVGLGVSSETADLLPEDPSVFIFIFKKVDYEVIDLDDDDEARSVRGRSSSIEILNEEVDLAPPLIKKSLPPPPPPPILRPECSPPASVVIPVASPKSKSQPSVTATVTPSLVKKSQPIAEVKANPAPPTPIEPQASTSKQSVVSNNSGQPSHTKSGSVRKPGPASHQREIPENGENKNELDNKSDSRSEPKITTSSIQLKTQKEPKHDQTVPPPTPPPHKLQPEQSNTKKNQLPSAPAIPQGQKRKIDSTDDFGIGKRNQSASNPPTTTEPETPKGGSLTSTSSRHTSGKVHINPNSSPPFRNVVTNLDNKERMSLDSSSGDDSSDGLEPTESASARVSSNNKSQPSVNRQMSSTDESSKLCGLPDANPTLNPFPHNPDAPTLPKKVPTTVLRLRLRQLIRLVGVTPSIRRCKTTVLTDSNRDKICKQWKASNKRCKAQTEQSRDSTTSESQSLSDSDSSEDYFVPLPPVVKKKKLLNSQRTEVKCRSSNNSKSTGVGNSSCSSAQKVTIKESKTLESGSDDAPPKRKRAKVSKTEEKKPDQQPNDVMSSPEHLSCYSQPYASPDHALSPISSDDMNMEQHSPLRPRINSSSDISENGDIHKMGTSPSSSPTYNPPPSPPAAINAPAEDTKKTQSGRQIKMINDAPLPREFRKKNGALERGRQDQSKHIPSTMPKQNQSIKERLKSIAEAENNRSPLPRDVPNLSRAPVNIKTTQRNRNEELIQSIIASSGVNKSNNQDDELEEHVQQKETSTGPTANSINKMPAIPAPRREIPPLPSPTTQAQMPFNHISTSMTLQHQQSNSGRGLPMPPPKPTPHLPEQLVNRMEKRGVALARQESKKEVYEYGHNSAIPQQQQPAQIDITNSRQIVPILEDDAGYKCVLKWRPSWLEEQKTPRGLGRPPPVTGGWETVRTLLHYEDYKSYAQTFFPLMLLETWASVTQDYFSKRRLMERESECTELPIVITGYQKTGVCPMTDVRWRDRVAKTRERYYTVVDCYAILNNTREFSQKRDLAICTFGIKYRDSDKTKKIIETKSEFFGYVLTPSQKTTPITDMSIIHQELRNKNPRAKYILTFQVVIHSGYELNRTEIGTIQKVAYISPKARDIKALVHLKHSKLHNAIIQTQPTKSTWNPNAIISQHQQVQYVAKLNPIQKSAVAYVAERVRSENEELVLVHGPPGTGKTRTVVGMILQLLALKDFKGDKRLLVCTPSNTALDEIMVRLEEAIKDLPSTSMSGKKITMLRFGETEGSSMKKYSVETYLRKIEDQNSMNVGIRKSIEICKKQIHTKQSEITTLEKNGGSKARIESLRRELNGLQNNCDEYHMDLERKKTETGSHSFEQKRTVLEKATVIFSTLNSCGNHVLTGVFGSRSGRKSKPFMCCIVDEASQTTEPETLAPLLLQVDKLILVGDPHQLGATLLSQEAESKGFGRSMFSRLYDSMSSMDKHQSIVMLTQQYRMHPDILAWPNEYFYNGMLKTQCIGRSADDECYKLKPYLFLNLSSQETSNGEGQISNEEEAKVVLGIIRNILAVLDSDTKSNKTFTIGVITPYSTQKNAISNDVKREFSSRAEVEVDTVDSFQGKEKDIVIISCVRTEDTGFLKNPKRLNVALTRARHSLLIIGDAYCLRKDNMWKSLIDNAKERKCLYNIPKTEWNVPGFLRKRLFQLLSPQKS